MHLFYLQIESKIKQFGFGFYESSVVFMELALNVAPSLLFCLQSQVHAAGNSIKKNNNLIDIYFKLEVKDVIFNWERIGRFHIP